MNLQLIPIVLLNQLFFFSKMNNVQDLPCPKSGAKAKDEVATSVQVSCSASSFPLLHFLKIPKCTSVEIGRIFV